MSLELIVAIYGALLATILAIIEIRKERKKITIILEYVIFSAKYNFLLIIGSFGTSIALWNHSTGLIFQIILL